MKQLLATTTRITMGSATPIFHTFHIHFFDNPKCGILDAGLNDHLVTLVKFSISCKKHDDTEITDEVFSFNCNENATQVYFEVRSNKLKMPKL